MRQDSNLRWTCVDRLTVYCLRPLGNAYIVQLFQKFWRIIVSGFIVTQPFKCPKTCILTQRRLYFCSITETRLLILIEEPEKLLPDRFWYKLVVGVEPTKGRLQIYCSTVVPHQHTRQFLIFKKKNC